MASKVADRCKQALVHIRLAVQAMESDAPADIVNDLRGIYTRIQQLARAGPGD